MPVNIDFFNPFSSRFFRSSDDLAALNAAEKSRNSWGISDTFDQFEARLAQESRFYGSNEFSTMGLLLDQHFAEKKQRIGWYRWMANVPIIKKCLTIMTNECVSPNERDQYASLSFNRSFKNKLSPSQMTTLQNEFDYVLNVCLKADDRTLWDLFFQWLTDGEMFWEIVPAQTGMPRAIGINVLAPDLTYPIYQKGRVIGFCEHLPEEYREALGLSPGLENILKFKPYQVTYCNYGKWGKVKQDIRGWLEPSIRALNQLIQMEDSLLAVRVNRAIERLVVNVNTGGVGPHKAKEALKDVKDEYNRQVTYDSATGRVMRKTRAISLKEMFWFAVDKDGQGTKIESLGNNTTLNSQIEDVKVFEKNIYDALEIAESRRGGDTDATYSNKHELGLQEMQMALSARRLSYKFAQNMVKKVFIQHLALRGYKPFYLNGDNYVVQMMRNNYYEKSRMFELNNTRAELMNAFANYMSSGENDNPKLSDEFVFSHILQFTDDELETNRQLLKKESMDKPAKKDDGGEDMF